MALYFIAIVAPEEIDDKVREWKNYMLENFGCKVALRSPAHITLIPPFNMPNELEAKMMNDLEEFNESVTAFDIGLNNFSSFPPRVIFVDVELTNELKQVKSEVEEFLIMRQYPVKRESRAFHPHVTLANRDLDRKDFKQAWEHFKNMSFHATFKAERVSLLRSEKGGWKVVD